MDASIVETFKQDALFSYKGNSVRSAALSSLGGTGFGGSFGVSGWECAGGLSESAGASGDTGCIAERGGRRSTLRVTLQPIRKSC